LAGWKLHPSERPTGKNQGWVRSGGCGSQEVEPLSQIITPAAGCLRMLSPHRGYVVAPCHVGKHHIICPQVCGALTTITTCDGRQFC